MHPFAIVLVPWLATMLAAALPAALAAQLPVAPLVGTVLAPDGKPVAGAAVLVTRSETQLFTCLDQDFERERITLARTITDKHGRFGAQLPAGTPLRVDVDVPPFARWVDAAVFPGDELVVQLEPACTVHGRLLDADGRGIPGEVWATRRFGRVELLRGPAGDDGRFRCERVPAGEFVLFATSPVAAVPPAVIGELAPGGEHEVVLACPRGAELTGVVTDAATGAPIAGARIGLGWRLQKAVPSDGDGAFTMRGFSVASQETVHCAAPGYARRAVQLPPADAGPLRVDFALERGVQVVGRVVDAAREPVADVYVAAIGRGEHTTHWEPARTAADGTFCITGFPRGIEGVLMLRKPGLATLVYFLPKPAGDGQIDFGTVAVRAPRLVSGVVRDENGAPLAGTWLQLTGVNGDAAWLATAPATWPRLASYANRRNTQTDAHGRFTFLDVAPGEYLLGAASAGIGERPVTVRADRELPPLELTR